RKDMDARLSDALASVSERLDDIHTQSDSALSPVQRAIAALASRLENLEAFNAPPGQPLPPPISMEPDRVPEPPRAAAPIAEDFSDEEAFESAASDESGMFDMLGSDDLVADDEPAFQASPPAASDNFESGLVDWDETGDALDDVSPYTADFEAIRAAAARISGAQAEPEIDDGMFDSGLPDLEETEDDFYDPLSELAGLEDAGSEARESDIFDDEDDDDAGDPFIAHTSEDGAPEDLIDTMESIDSEHPPKLDDTTSDYLARARRAALAASESGSKGRAAKSAGQKRGPGKTPLYLAASAMVLTGAGAGGYLYLRGKQAPEPAISAPLDTYVDPQLAAAPPVAGDAVEAAEPFADFAANTAPAASEDDLFDTDIAAAEDDSVLTSAARPAELEAMGGPATKIAALTPVRYPQIPPVVTVETEANAGNGIAQYQLAVSRRAEGRLEEAIPLLRRSALKGIAPAQYELGKHHERGEGVDLDFIQARHLIGQAAEAGHVGAMYDYALFLSEGEGGPKAEAEAVRWFQRAADHGLVDAQYNLGVVHAEGMGTPRDLSEALYWFELARRAGDNAADLEVRNLSARLPEDTVISVMEEADSWRAASPAGLANGRFGAQSWNTGNPLQVRGVQTALDALGFDPGVADGVLGQRTADAIRDYQRAEGLSVTGTVTPELIERLNTGATSRRG
ncbi:MAG: peptidoglycan-binding protein, partial [Hyphomonas sp.]